MIQDAALVADKLWVLSTGKLFCLECSPQGLAGASWKEVASDAWTMEPDGDRLWVLTSKGVDCYDGADGGVKQYTSEDGLAAGRHKFLAVTDKTVWLATDPKADEQTSSYVGGGLSRFDRAARRWSNLTAINDLPVTQITCLMSHNEEVWVASVVFDKLLTLSAHPGMMHCKRLVPHATGLALHRYVPDKDEWETIKCDLPQGQERYILGQKGSVRRGRLVPKLITGLACTPTRICCTFEMLPGDFYGGYCHSIGLFAERPSPTEPWMPRLRDLTRETGLEGEQPELLLVSESHGKAVVFAEGQPRALHLAVHAGRLWALSETTLACAGDDGAKWQKVLETSDRFYWEASAAVADQRYFWVGGDGGTVSRLDKGSLECEIVGWLRGRKITGLSLDEQGKLWVQSAETKAVMPAYLKGLPEVSSSGLAVYDGKSWKEAEPGERPPASKTGRREWYCRTEGDRRHRFNVLYTREAAADGGGERRHAYLRGVFKPQVLCQDEEGKVLWLKIYEGILRINLPQP